GAAEGRELGGKDPAVGQAVPQGGQGWRRSPGQQRAAGGKGGGGIAAATAGGAGSGREPLLLERVGVLPTVPQGPRHVHLADGGTDERVVPFCGLRSRSAHVPAAARG